MMKEQLTERLEKLKGEFESGQKMLADLEARQVNLQQTLLRISGAIQVIEELLAQESQTVPEESDSRPEPAEKIGAAA